MSTQQDIYVAGSETRPPMLNKENYVPWSSLLLRYAKSIPNGKLIYNSIINGPYVRRLISEQGDQNRKVPVNETFHEQTDDELTEKELKQVEADDQAIQTILLGLPKEIYATVDSCETAQEIWLHVQQMMKGSDIGTQEKKSKLFNEWERFTSTDGESIDSYYHRFSKLMNDFKRNKHFPKKIASNLKLLNRNPNGNGNVIAARAEGNVNRNNGNQIRCYNCRGLGHLARNCTVRPRRRDVAYLQTQLLIAQKEEVGIPLKAKEFDLMAAAGDLDEIEETDQLSMVQGGGIVEQHPAIVEETRAYFESLYNNLAIEVEKVNTVNRKLRETNADLTTELARYKNQECFEISQEKYDKLEREITVVILVRDRCPRGKDNLPRLPIRTNIVRLATPSMEAAKFVRDFKSLAKEVNESLAKHKALEFEIERLLRAIVSQDIMSIVQNPTVVETCNLQTELERFLNKTKGTSANTKFANQSTVRKPSLQSLRKIFMRQPNEFQSERQNFSKPRVPQKVDETNDLSNLVTSNSVPTPQESKVMKNDNVISPGMFRINSFKTSREEKSMPNKPIKASVKTKSITISQPHVTTKKDVNSDSNGLSSIGIDNIAKTRRP
ncbi:retrovirus-related pol polyprotein from transposon TNT 1-94 [Tanacetum coccineum]|uniref:Retrovirus-related pol polyprotein from transposon TNT 1-94 n=1 Tax=Tanacetum coccineum TaxID=301880 RepID=A0ABQ4YW39_9ASTR